jgi:sulfofructose kinase
VDELRLERIAIYAPTERALLARYPDLGLQDALDAALSEGPRIVAATRGAAGSVAVEREPDGSLGRHSAPAVDTTIVSTLGAGDVFHGALLAALLDDQPLGEALRFANAAAGLSCRALDGRSGIPARREVEELLAGVLAADARSG